MPGFGGAGSGALSALRSGVSAFGKSAARNGSVAGLAFSLGATSDGCAISAGGTASDTGCSIGAAAAGCTTGSLSAALQDHAAPAMTTAAAAIAISPVRFGLPGRDTGGGDNSGSLFRLRARERSRITDETGRVGHAELEVGGTSLYLSDEWAEIGVRSPKHLGGVAVSFVISVSDSDAVFSGAVEAGARVDRPVRDEPYGRGGWIFDPWGHHWNILTPQATE